MDPKKLDALRARYRDARGGEIYDPDFRAVAATQWHDGGRRNFPFSGIPTLLDPADGVPMGEGMPLVTANSVDPEGSAVVHDFKLMDLRDAVIETGDAIEQGDDSTIWVPSALEEGNYQWTARARDADGIASEWAVPRSFVVGTPDQVEEPELGGMIVNGKSDGCSGASGGRGSAQWVWLVGILAVVAQRRKRLRP